MIDYGDVEHKLKVECSYREIYDNNKSEYTDDNKLGILVYDINKLADMKAHAIASRTKIRDFYDLCFIINNYWDKLEEHTKSNIRNTFAYRNFEYVDYLCETQKDDLVMSEKLREMFLNTFDKTHLFYTEEEKAMLTKKDNNKEK